MATIVTRAGKGSPLTNAEVDANFTNINTELGTKANSSALASYLPLTGGIVGGQLEAGDLLVKYNSATSWTTRLATPWDQPAEVLNMNESGFSALTFHVVNKYANLFGYDENNILKSNNNTIWHSGNFTPSSYLLLTGGTVSGILNTTASGIFTAHVGYNPATDTERYTLGGFQALNYGMSIGEFGGNGNGLRANLAGYYGVSIGTNGATRLSVDQSGVTTAFVEMRSPVFRDSDDSSYYLNPNGFSQISSLDANNYLSTPTLYMRGDINLLNAAQNGYNSVVVRNGGDNWIVYGGSGGVRAPIFYDTDNTVYYIDPTGVSNLAGLTVNGGAAYRSDWTASFMSSSDFVDGTLVTTDIPATAQDGDSFIIEITGKSYSDSNPPFKVVAQGYLYNNGIISNSGISYGGDFAASIKVFQDGGVLKFWWPRISYWNSFEVRVLAVNGPTNGTITRNRVTAISNSTEPTGTKKVTVNVVRSLREDAWINNKYFGSNGAIYGTQFADANNTAYYVDPLSTSVLNNVRAATIESTNGFTAINLTNSTYNILNDPTGRTAIYLGSGSDANSYYDNTTHNFRNRDSGLYAYISSSGIWAGAFTDFNNTAYYLDPAGNSVVGNIFAHGQIRATGWWGSQSASGTGLGIEIGQSAGRSFILSYNRNATTYGPMSFEANDFAFNGVSGGYAQINTSFRAPVFYDSNNTNFYVDPQGGSVFGGAVAFSGGSYVATNGDIYARRDNAATGVYYFADGGSKYLYWDGSTYIFGSAGPVQNGLGFYAPIFYDLNNTSYYIDAASTSVLNTLMVATGVGAYDSNNDPYGKISVTRNTDANYSYYGLTRAGQLGMGMGIDTSNNFWIGTTSAGYNGTRNASWFSINNSGQVTALGDFRAPLFYDTNNTAYYLDPNSGSRLNGVTVDNLYSYGTIVAASSLTVGDGATNSYIYMADSDEGTRTIHCNSNRIGFLSQAGGWGSWCDDDGAWRTDHAMWAPIFYDSNNSGYYVDANNNSNLYSLTLSGGTYFQPNSWIQFNGQYGLYWPNNNGAHIEANVSSSYGQLGLRGNRNGYGGIYDAHSGVNGFMYDGAGNGGVYREANGRWYFYHSVANNCTGFGTSSTASGYDIYAATGIYSGGRVDGTIFYDSNNTGYYTDPNGTSRVNLINADTLRSYSNIYTDANYGFGLVGVYTPTRYQGVFAMGDSYKLPADGTTTGSLYGIAWSHPNAGGVASNLNTHGALIMENGTFLAALSGSIRCRDDMRAPLFYDRDNSAYYTDPAGTSVLATVNFGSNPNTGGGGGRIVPSVGSPYSIRQEFGSDNSGWRYGVAKNVGGTVTVLFYVQDSGDCVATGNLTAYSDIRVKDNVETVDNALHKLAAIRGVTYTRTDLDDKERRYAGVIAQELEQVLPEAVGGDEHTKTVDYNATIALLIQAVKELKAKVEVLEAQTCH